ncbi:MAG: hypothetical protein Q8881_03295 [Sweet potato little leaf phytoplasma]|nr:hypothetical protein [Sweet potato little leaf phytoplasma]
MPNFALGDVSPETTEYIPPNICRISHSWTFPPKQPNFRRTSHSGCFRRNDRMNPDEFTPNFVLGDVSDELVKFPPNFALGDVSDETAD